MNAKYKAVTECVTLCIGEKNYSVSKVRGDFVFYADFHKENLHIRRNAIELYQKIW